MIVFCCGMTRSASTFQYAVAAHLVETKGRGRKIGVWCEYSEAQLIKFANDSKMFVGKDHDFSPLAKSLVEQGKGAAIYCYRDPRDVIVSCMDKHRVPFYRSSPSYVLKRILHDYYQWMGVRPILISRYEDMMQYPSDEVERIATFLKIPLEPGEAAKIAREYSVEEQKKRIAAYYRDHEVRDPDSLLSRRHIKSGEPGRWRKSLRGLEVAFVEKYTASWLLERGYPVTKNWLVRTMSCWLYTGPILLEKVKTKFLIGFKGRFPGVYGRARAMKRVLVRSESEK